MTVVVLNRLVILSKAKDLYPGRKDTAQQLLRGTCPELVDGCRFI